MSQMIAGARARAYLTLLSWLGDKRLRHCDVARDRHGEVVAVTFARDRGYIEHVREIESAKSGAEDRSLTEHAAGPRLRWTMFVLAGVLAILALGMVLEDVIEKAFS